ncbi:MAG: hypothetical protein EOM80_19150 [Erysipelotrichia bacterium]|nr:hypothetical protein [Erysipelotrichia bacterium]
MERVFVVRYHAGHGVILATTNKEAALSAAAASVSIDGVYAPREMTTYSLVDYIDQCKAAKKYAALYLKSKRIDTIRERDGMTDASFDRLQVIADATKKAMRDIVWEDGEMIFDDLGMWFTQNLWEGSVK